MRIDQLILANYKLFEHREFTFHPQFNVLVGSNGTGKSSVINGLAVALGIWLVEPPDTELYSSGRDILDSEIRLEALARGDRVQFEQRRPTYVSAIGQIGDRQPLQWKRSVPLGQSETHNDGADEALELIAGLYSRADSEALTLPILGHYGAGRAWAPANERMSAPTKGFQPARRWAAFNGCLSETILFADLREWFSREALASVSYGKLRPGAEAVKRAILECLPDARDLWFDADRADIVADLAGVASPFSNLSDGQRTVLSMVADIAIRAVTQNAHLLSDESSRVRPDQALPRVLAETPGVVLIDELDVHLHPKWQRRVQTDLTRTFPALQFICTSHSPFIIQGLQPGQLIPLEEGAEGVEYSGKPLADIAEGVQDVPMPDRSLREEELSRATEEYFRLLRDPGVPEEDLRRAEADYRKASEPYTDLKGLNAVLKLEAMAAGKVSAL